MNSVYVILTHYFSRGATLASIKKYYVRVPNFCHHLSATVCSNVFPCRADARNWMLTRKIF